MRASAPSAWKALISYGLFGPAMTRSPTGGRDQLAAVGRRYLFGVATRSPCGDHFVVRLATEGTMKPALSIEDLDRGTLHFATNGHDRSIRTHRHRPASPALIRAAPQAEGVPEGAAVVEEGDPVVARMPRDDRISRPLCRPGQTAELRGTLPLPTPGQQVHPGGGEYPYLVRAAIRHHDASVRKPVRHF